MTEYVQEIIWSKVLPNQFSDQLQASITVTITILVDLEELMHKDKELNFLKSDV